MDRFTITKPALTVLTICFEEKQLRLHVVDGVLTVDGDLPMDKAAEMFVDELKRIFARG